MKAKERPRVYYKALCLFHIVYYMLFSSMTFLPRYFAELGMTDSQIGMLMSLPSILGVLCQPFWGTLTDRVRVKRLVLIGLLAALAALCFVLHSFTGFAMLMLGLTAFSVLQLPISPINTAISLEYTRQAGYKYGPIRLLGTVGYQLGALVVGLVFVSSLRGLYRYFSLILLVSCAIACFLPPVEGHQHGHRKVSVRALLQDRHLRALLGMVLIGSTTQQFYASFFSKYLGDLGISTTINGLMLILSVIFELPFLLFADKLARKASIWNIILLGYVVNAVRWLGIAFSRSVVPMIIFQLPAVTIMACFEFYPALYINRKTSDALKSSAQTALTVVGFGISKVIGSLFGGIFSDLAGIPVVFAFNGILLLLAAVLLWRPTRRLMAAEDNAPCE